MRLRVNKEAFALAGWCAMAAGCTTLMQPGISRSVAPSPAEAWSPEAGESIPGPTDVASVSAQIAVGERGVADGAVLSLPRVIAIGLENNVQTRSAFDSARAAAAGLGSARSAYFPTVEIDGNGGASSQVVAAGEFLFQQVAVGPSASLTWLLLDLGARGGAIDEAKSALLAANLGHNAAVQDTILAIERAFYAYLESKALLGARQSTLQEAERAFDAANARRKEGVATIADVLKAQVALSQARFDLQDAQRQDTVNRGTLAVTLGFPANTAINVEDLPEHIAVEKSADAIDALMTQAEKQRPDLARARAQVIQARNHVSTIRGRGLPSLVLNANAGRSFFINHPVNPTPPCVDNTGGCAYGDAYGASLLLRIPIFDGFRDTYDLAQAEALVDVAKDQADALELQVMLQVWSSYQLLKTAEQQLVTATDLLKSAKESADVAEAQYKAGVGSILDLLAAQAALASARAQEVGARAQWLLAVAGLAHDTGRLSPPTRGQEAKP